MQFAASRRRLLTFLTKFHVTLDKQEKVIYNKKVINFMRREKNSMKKTVSILTALLLAVSPAAQRAYAQETTIQVQQNVEESKASKVWNTVKEYAGKAANAVVENKEVVAGVAGVALLIGAGVFTAYNGVTLIETIKTIWAAEGITIAQKVQLIAKVLFLRKGITAAELTNLKNKNIVAKTTIDINNYNSKITDTNKTLTDIEKKQTDFKKELTNAMCQKKKACDEYKKAQEELGKGLKDDKTCQLGEEYGALDCSEKVE